MFQGTITEVGGVASVEGRRLEIDAPKTVGQLEAGDAVAVCGVRLTVEEVGATGFRCTLSEQTVERTTLADMPVGTAVNVEAPVRAGDTLHGHLVQGHVEATGKVVRITDEGRSRRVWIRPPGRLLDDVAAKGSIAVDGVSLTVAEVVRDRFSVALIPATLEATTLAALSVGDRVHLEGDALAKLARRHGTGVHDALAGVVGALPWAGIVSGRSGVEKVVSQLAAGGTVLVWDPSREGEADVIAAGADLRPETLVFFLTQACGHTTVPCDLERLRRLEIPAMPGAGDRHGTAPHVPVDLATSSGSGVSAHERAATIRRLADAAAHPGDFLRPGHVFPLHARPGGLSERAGHTEAAVELCRAAGLPTVAAICEVMGAGGRMAGHAELELFALRWGLPMVDIGDLVAML